MKTNLKIDNKNFIAEISLSNEMPENEMEVYNAYMHECTSNDTMFVDTAGLNSNDAKVMCGLAYKKHKTMFSEGAGELTENQKNLPASIKKGILKRYEKSGTLSEEGKKQLSELHANVEIEIENEESEDEQETENEVENDAPTQEMQAEPTAVFVQESAPPTSAINLTLMNEGLKIDDKLKQENKSDGPKSPDLQSATFKA